MSSSRFANNAADYLYKEAARRGLPAPVFAQTSELGPPHQKTFVWEVNFCGFVSQGQGRSKKEAKLNAANAMHARCKVVEMTEEELKASNAAVTLPEHAVNLAGYRDPDFSPNVSKHVEKKQKKNKNNNNSVEPLMNPMMMMPNFDFFAPNYDTPMFYGTGGGYGQPGFHSAPFPMMRPMMAPIPPPRSMMRPHPPQMRLGRDDEHVTERHRQIQPLKNVLDRLIKMAEAAEFCLRRVADDIDEDDEDKLLGVTRVGPLGKGLLLRHHDAADLVLVCKKAPTKKFLASIKLKLEDAIVAAKAEAKVVKEQMKDEDDNKDDDDEDDDFKVEYAEGGFRIVSVLKETAQVLRVNVTLTSPSLRKQADDEENGDEEEEEGKAPEEDQLDVSRCLWALAEMRRTKFFSCAGRGVPSCAECARLLIDLALRDDAWTPFRESTWPLEVLCERVLSSASSELTPSKAFRRIFEALAAGVLTTEIRDPCEREEVDIFAGISDEDKEALTASAQKALRRIAFGSINEVLGTEKVEKKKKRQQEQQQEQNVVEMDVEEENDDAKKAKI